MKIFLLFIAVVVLAQISLFSQVIAEGPFAGLNLTVVPAQYHTIVLHAGEDCMEVEALRPPKHAKPFGLEVRDGGTRQFVGDGYIIVVRHSLFILVKDGEKVPGYSYGYELYWGSSEWLEKHPGISAVVSKVWFLPNGRSPTQPTQAAGPRG